MHQIYQICHGTMEIRSGKMSGGLSKKRESSSLSHKETEVQQHIKVTWLAITESRKKPISCDIYR